MILLTALEGIGFLLSNADEYNPIFYRMFSTYLGSNIVFALSTLKMQGGNVVLFGYRLTFWTNFCVI